MPYKKGSCLNEECTEIIVKTHKLLTEAKEKYTLLPACVRCIETEHERNCGNNLGWYLISGETSASSFAREFGIDVER